MFGKKIEVGLCTIARSDHVVKLNVSVDIRLTLLIFVNKIDCEKCKKQTSGYTIEVVYDSAITGCIVQHS